MMTAVVTHLEAHQGSLLVESFLRRYSDWSIPLRYPIDTLSKGEARGMDGVSKGEIRNRQEEIGNRERQKPARAPDERAPDDVPDDTPAREKASYPQGQDGRARETASYPQGGGAVPVMQCVADVAPGQRCPARIPLQGGGHYCAAHAPAPEET
jgi:hypothetical protein